MAFYVDCSRRSNNAISHEVFVGSWFFNSYTPSMRTQIQDRGSICSLGRAIKTLLIVHACLCARPLRDKSGSAFTSYEKFLCFVFCTAERAFPYSPKTLICDLVINANISLENKNVSGSSMNDIYLS